MNHDSLQTPWHIIQVGYVFMFSTSFIDGSSGTRHDLLIFLFDCVICHVYHDDCIADSMRACEFFRCFGDNLLALYSIHLTLSQAFATCQIPKIEFGIGPKCNEIDGRMREVQGS